MLYSSLLWCGGTPRFDLQNGRSSVLVLRFFKQCLETLELGVGVELGVRCHGTLTYGHLMICAEDGAVLVECSYVAVASSVICCTIQENPCGCND